MERLMTNQGMNMWIWMNGIFSEKPSLMLGFAMFRAIYGDTPQGPFFKPWGKKRGMRELHGIALLDVQEFNWNVESAMNCKCVFKVTISGESGVSTQTRSYSALPRSAISRSSGSTEPFLHQPTPRTWICTRGSMMRCSGWFELMNIIRSRSPECRLQACDNPEARTTASVSRSYSTPSKDSSVHHLFQESDAC